MKATPLRVGLAALILSVPLISGCLAAIGAGAALGVGAVAYANGSLESMQDVSLARCWTATQLAMGDLEYTIVSERKDALEAELVSRQADDKKVTVHLKKMNEKTVKLTVRVGTFGDEAKSRLILERIRAHF